MASINNKITVSQETRLCTVKGELGYFHTWEHWSRPVEASPLIGGAPAGVISQVFGIVEFSSGVNRVEPYLIKFCDEQNAILNEMAKHYRDEKERK